MSRGMIYLCRFTQKSYNILYFIDCLLPFGIIACLYDMFLHNYNKQTVQFCLPCQLDRNASVLYNPFMEGDYMKFSLWNFKEWYERHGIDLSYMISDNTASVSLLSVAGADMDERLGYAVIYPGERFTDCTGFRTVLCFERDRILFPVASTAEVMDQGAAMIEYYTRWENHLLDLITENRSVDDIINASRELFPFPTALLEPNGTILSQTPDWPYQLSNQTVCSLFHSALPGQPRLRTLIFENSTTLLLEPVCFENLPHSLLIACENQKKFQPGSIPVFHTLVTAIQSVYHFRANMLPVSHPLSAWLTHCINAIPDTSEEKTLLARAGWMENDYLAVAYICSASNRSLPGELASALTGASHCCVLMSESLCLLSRLGSTPDINTASAYLKARCSSDTCKIGLSLPFQGLRNVPVFYQQAQWAIQYSQDDSNLISVTEILPQLICQACSTLPAVQALIHPAVTRLAEIATQEKDDLLNTLYIYLTHGHSIAQTADALFIHRNTLRLRLHKMQSVLSVDLNDPVICEQILLSLLFFKHEWSADRKNRIVKNRPII